MTVSRILAFVSALVFLLAVFAVQLGRLNMIALGAFFLALAVAFGGWTLDRHIG